MDDPSNPPAAPVMAPAEARRRFLLYFGVRLLGLASLFVGIFLLARDAIPLGALCTIAGAASLFIRPRNLGLTRPPEP
jgi:hypothetical protein